MVDDGDIMATARGQAPGVSLVLGAGGARGIAAAGVFRAFEESELAIDELVGTSMGALLGAIYARSGSADEVIKAALAMTGRDFFFPAIAAGGLGSSRRLLHYVRSLVGDGEFSTLRVPLTVACTDIQSGEPVFITSGRIAEAITASCSIAGLHPPFKIGTRQLVDGGYSGPLHVAQATRSAVFAFDPCMAESRPVLDPRGPVGPLSWARSLFDHHMKGFDIVLWRLSRLELSRNECILIRPDVGAHSPFDFSRQRMLVEAGYTSGSEAIHRYRHSNTAPGPFV